MGSQLAVTLEINQSRIESMEMKPSSFDFRMIGHHGLMPFACSSAFDFTHHLFAVGSKRVRSYLRSLICKSEII